MTWDPIGDLFRATGQTAKDIYYGNYDVLGVPQDYLRGAFGKKAYGSFQPSGNNWVSELGTNAKKPGKGVTVAPPGSSAGGFRAVEETQKNQAKVGSVLSGLEKWLKDNGVGQLDTVGDAGMSNPLMSLAGLFGAGGGGSTASERLAALKARNATNAASGIMDMISSGSYAEPYKALSGTLADYLSKAQTGIEGLYGDAKTAVKQAYATNPYANLKGTGTVASSGLEGLLASQGASTDPLAQMVAANREAAGGRAAAFNDLAKMLGANFQAAGTQAQSDIGAMQAGSLQDLLSSGAGYQATIAAQQAAALKALRDQLMESANQGADLASLVRRKRK